MRNLITVLSLSVNHLSFRIFGRRQKLKRNKKEKKKKNIQGDPYHLDLKVRFKSHFHTSIDSHSHSRA